MSTDALKFDAPNEPGAAVGLAVINWRQFKLHILHTTLLASLWFGGAHASEVTGSSEGVTKSSTRESRQHSGVSQHGEVRQEYGYETCSSGEPSNFGFAEHLSLNSDISLEPEGDRFSGALRLDVLFKSGSAQIGRTSHPLLRNLAQALGSETLQRSSFVIVEHTGLQGNNTEVGRRENLELSCACTNAIRTFLAEQGVDINRLAVYGFGSHRPFEPYEMNPGVNRRVEIHRIN